MCSEDNGSADHHRILKIQHDMQTCPRFQESEAGPQAL